jgi:rhomboid protease GluP
LALMVEEMREIVEHPNDEEWLTVGCWPSLTAAYDHALVVLAMNLDCRVDDGGGGCYAVRADPAHREAIREEFAHFAEEESNQRERVESPVFPAGVGFAAIWAAVLLAVFWRQADSPGLTRQFSNSSEALFAFGEWWRPFTALFLHGDLGHLMGNVLIGGLFCLMAAQSIGASRAWPLILAGGTLGNALTAWIYYPEPFHSIGASTATFAAVGILVGGSTRRAWQNRSYQYLKPLWIPAGVAVIVLGWLGVGGENTDVAGHVAGLLSGVLLGLVAGVRRST